MVNKLLRSYVFLSYGQVAHITTGVEQATEIIFNTTNVTVRSITQQQKRGKPNTCL
jgi:hypothetical protein